MKREIGRASELTLDLSGVEIRSAPVKVLSVPISGVIGFCSLEERLWSLYTS